MCKTTKLFFLLFFISPFVNGQTDPKTRYDFVNFFMKTQVIENLDFYYLYSQPITIKWDKELSDSLKNHLDPVDFVFVKESILAYDTNFKWDQSEIIKGKVIDNEKSSEIRSKNMHQSNFPYKNGKPIITPRPLIPKEEQQYFELSIPIFNKTESLVIIYFNLIAGNHGEYQKFIYHRINNHWELLTHLRGITMHQAFNFPINHLYLRS